MIQFGAASLSIIFCADIDPQKQRIKTTLLRHFEVSKIIPIFAKQ